MKEVELNIKPEDINEESFNEKQTDINLEVSEFNPNDAYLELPEDINEKTVSYIEREVRDSYEYREYISYLKNELNLTKCALLPGIDCSDGAASLEFHHFPMNLYEITEAVGNKMINELPEGEFISCFDISEKVMEEHFRGNIGLVPLTKSLHEMAHNRAILIPMSKINGNYKKFIKKYSDYIPQDIKDRITEAEMNNDGDDAKIFNESKLEKNILKFNIKYKDSDNAEEENDEE